MTGDKKQIQDRTASACLRRKVRFRADSAPTVGSHLPGQEAPPCAAA
jgi:hypothetical protein